MLDGRELDCLVAVHVMGAKHSEAVEREWMHFPETGPFTDCECEGHMAAQICPHYSTEIGAAWQVVEKIRNGHCCTKVYSDHDYIWECSIIKDPDTEHDGIPDAFGQADTAPLAICLAALKAVGYEPKETA